MKTKNYCITLLALLCFSCNNSTQKSKKGIDKILAEDSVVKKYSNGVISLANSTNIPEILCQEWVQEDDAQTLKDVDETSMLSLSIRTFHFFNDGSFIKNYRNAWDYGNWDYNNATKTITLNNKMGGDRDVYKIASIATDELNVVNKGINSSTVIKFLSSEKALKVMADEPFHINNNQWRIKPAHKETDAEVKLRLKENLQFFVLFYRAAIAKDDRVISFYGLPGCLKWYGGGIYMKDKNELNDEWINCFYNKEQALKAYTLMEKVMDKKYSWPKENIGWVKKNLFVLEQMVKNLDTVN